MKILMLSPYLPWPLYGGSSVRMFNIIKELSHQGNRIILIAGYNETPAPTSNLLTQFCEEIHLYKLPKIGRLGSAIHSLFSFLPYPGPKFLTGELEEKASYLLKNKHFDLIWVNFLFMADVLLPLNLATDIPVVLDQHEADELIWWSYIRRGSIAHKVFSFINLIKVQRLQRKIFPHIDAILCVSEAEAEFTRSKAPADTKVWVVPNGVDVDFFCPTFRDKREPIILLVGSMNVFRNIDAAVWIARNMFPQVKQAIPNAQFWIVGSNPDKMVLKLQGIEGVKAMGTVEDVRPHYERARVCVAPYRFGEGTRLKLFEALAMGVPIVSTSFGCQGIDVMNGQHLLITDTEADFCDQVIELLSNPQRAQELAQAGRALVELKYNWKKIVDNIESKLQELVHK